VVFGGNKSDKPNKVLPYEYCYSTWRDYHSSGGYPAISFAAAVAEQTQAGERELLSTQGGRDCSMSELSEYERKRLQRIRENESFLKTLGAFWLSHKQCAGIFSIAVHLLQCAKIRKWACAL